MSNNILGPKKGVRYTMFTTNSSVLKNLENENFNCTVKKRYN